MDTEIRTRSRSSRVTSNVINSSRSNRTSKRFFITPRIALYAAIATAIVLMPLQLGWSFAHAQSVDVWWPTNGAHVAGTQPFKVMIPGLDVSQYEMFWQVDNGGWVWMDNNYTDYQHKEALVNVDGWNWRGSGPYRVNFIARQNGAVIMQQGVDIYIDNGQPGQSQTTNTQTASAPIMTQSVSAQAAPVTKVASIDTIETTHSTLQLAPVANTSINSSGLYVEPNSNAEHQASAWRGSRPADAAKMDVLAAQPTAKWFGGWSGDIQSAANAYVSQAASAGKTAMLVAYNIPQRDCGGYSAGGVGSKDAYLNWIGGMARGIGNRSAIVILEPDALPGLDCLSRDDQNTRTSMLSSAVSILKSNGNTKVYLDAGNSNWKSAQDMAPRLQQANLAAADGFSLNVSGFQDNSSSINFGTQVSQLVGGKHFVVDTSRNGNGSNGEWCNPWGRAIGQKPSTNTGNGLIDAFLWIKTPGESDGNCNGGPSAGAWWPEYAVQLVP